MQDPYYIRKSTVANYTKYPPTADLDCVADLLSHPQESQISSKYSRGRTILEWIRKRRSWNGLELPPHGWDLMGIEVVARSQGRVWAVVQTESRGIITYSFMKRMLDRVASLPVLTACLMSLAIYRQSPTAVLNEDHSVPFYLAKKS